MRRSQARSVGAAEELLSVRWRILGSKTVRTYHTPTSPQIVLSMGRAVTHCYTIPGKEQSGCTNLHPLGILAVIPAIPLTGVALTVRSQGVAAGTEGGDVRCGWSTTSLLVHYLSKAPSQVKYSSHHVFNCTSINLAALFLGAATQPAAIPQISALLNPGLALPGLLPGGSVGQAAGWVPGELCRLPA